jgi:DNA-binding LytR/AlgR family response regulator
MRKKILIIEDDLDVRENLVTLLSEEGYNASSAKDGLTGVKLVKEDSPDLIICDIMMNGISGYEVLGELTKGNLIRTIPFIFLTAKADIENIRLGMQLGADDYILKPFNANELLNSIETRLKKVEAYKAENNNTGKNAAAGKYSIEDKIFIHSEGNPILIKISDIVSITAENQYSSLRMADKKNHLVRRSISFWEDSLPSKYFIRIHRSTVINLDYLVKIEKWYNASLLVYLKEIKEPYVISKRFSVKIKKIFF